MVNVSIKISLTQIREDAEPGKMADVFNVLKDGILIKMKSVLSFHLYAIHGIKMEIVKNAIEDTQ